MFDIRIAIKVLNPEVELNQTKIQFLSDALAFLLLAVYIAGLIFTFFTHKHLFTTRLVDQDVNRIVITEKNNNIEENPQQLEIHRVEQEEIIHSNRIFKKKTYS